MSVWEGIGRFTVAALALGAAAILIDIGRGAGGFHHVWTTVAAFLGVYQLGYSRIFDRRETK